MIPLDEPQRIDKWLWASRFFKTRALAKSEVTQGRVLLNDKRVKPAHTVKPGDVLFIVRGEDQFTITVQQLVKSRVSAKLAQELYQEHEQSVLARAARREAARSEPSVGPRKRPDKRNRRKIIRFKSEHGSD